MIEPIIPIRETVLELNVDIWFAAQYGTQEELERAVRDAYGDLPEGDEDA